MADATIKIRGGAGNAVQIQSRNIDAAAPSDGQALAWSSSDSEWEPTTVGGGSSEWTDTGSVLHPTESTVDNVVVGGTTTANSDIVLGVDGAAVFNEQGADADFRVESDTKTHMLFVDAGTNQVGINTSASVNKSLSVVDSALIKGKALFTLTGTIDPAASTTVTGSGTAFLTEVSPGDQLVVSGETRTVRSVTNDTTLVLDVPFTNGSNDTSPDCNPAAFTVLKDGGTVAFSVDGDETVQVGTCFKIQTEDDATVNQSARLFFKESITDNLYGFSQFYTGDANPVFAGTTLTAPANSFNIFRHNNAEAGVPVMTMERGTGNIGVGDDGSGGITVPNEKITVDGAVSLKAQDSSTSTTAGYAKIYAEEGGPDTDTLLLLHMEGENNGQLFFDSTGRHTITVGNDAKTSTAQEKFGVSSLYCDGTDDYLEVGASEDFSFGTGDWTVECWIKTAGNGEIFSLGHPSGSSGGMRIFLESGKLKFSGGNQDSYLDNTVTFNDDAWHHLAVVRDGSTITGYKDGVAGANPQSPNSNPIGWTDYPARVGIRGDELTNDFTGYIDELRVSSTARYTSNFTSPSSAFSGTVSEGRLVLPDRTRLAARTGDLGQVTAKAWISFVGTGTVAIQDSFNVSSLADDGVGAYTINYSNDFPNANYSVAGACNDISYGGTLSIYNTTSKLVASLKIATHDKDTQEDAGLACVVCFGDS
jgi:hypothetical protein